MLALVGYYLAVRQGMKVQLVTLYRVSHLQRYGVMVRGNVTSVYPPLVVDRNDMSVWRAETLFTVVPSQGFY